MAGRLDRSEDVDFSLPPIDEPSAGGNASATTNGESRPKVVQPTPKALAQRSGPSSILVSPRQKGNPLLKHIKSMPWEYSDMPADYVVGATTCAFFLSIKYHRLHPEYIYGRIRALQGKYNLRILLTLVDVDDHEEPLKELSKTSLINNVTIVLCWSAQEAARYLELYKTYEFATPTSIKGHKSESYADKMIEFITVPRSINKTDAVGLVSNFGSLRTAINAQPEEISLIAGWGEKKVQRWCQAVREPFRIKKAAKRGLGRENTNPVPSLARDVSRGELDPEVQARIGMSVAASSLRPPSVGELGSASGASRSSSAAGIGVADADRRTPLRTMESVDVGDEDLFDEEASTKIEAAPKLQSTATALQAPPGTTSAYKRPAEEPLEDGVAAALAKLRKG